MFRVCFIVVLIIGMLIGCVEKEGSSDAKQRVQTEKALAEAHRQIGMPAIKNFQERKLAKMIFELRDQENFTTYAYITTWDGKLIFIGQCVGYGLPYSVQYTNPQKTIYYSDGGSHSLPQADPNGLFMPEGLSATWLMMKDSKGEVRPVYIEQEVIVSPFKLH